MANIPLAVRLKCEDILAAPLQNIENISGGDINQARLIQTESKSCFLKMNDLPQSLHMFETEAQGLQLIQKSKSISAPEILYCGVEDGLAFLLLSYITPNKKTDKFWKNFGQSLALLHRDNTHHQFGLDHSNFIGSLPQANEFEEDWISFYINQRILPQLTLAFDTGKLPISISKNFEKLFNKLNEFFPKEPSALTHGDLWSGNFLIGPNEQAILIDPAVAYTHREMDIAMTHLFGGFSQNFYAAYQNTYPLEKGFHDRIDLYQLYYLMVHLNLFGESYVGSVTRIIEKFA